MRDIGVWTMLLLTIASPFIVGYFHNMPDNIRPPLVNRYFEWIDRKYDNSNAAWITSRLARRVMFTFIAMCVALGIVGNILLGRGITMDAPAAILRLF
jgi:hypothetical protein